MDRAIEKGRESEMNGVMYALRTVYFLAKKNLPNDDFGDLIDFQISQGVSNLKELTVNGNTNYRHNSSVKEFQRALAKVVVEDLLEVLRDSGQFGIMLDESTGRSSEKTLIIYVKYHVHSIPKTRFLCVTELEGGTAEIIYNTVVQICTAYGINLRKCVAVASEGASVMVGIRSGVVTRVKQLAPFIVAVHCVAHRLSLAISQAAHSVRYLDTHQETLTGIFKYYHYSHTHLKVLKNMQAVLELANIKFKEVFDTRWLS
jgi:hypothetical protein